MGQFGIGQALPRLEDRRLVTGGGCYTDDISRPGQCYGVVVRSPLAHAKILSLDLAAARAAPGVLAVYSGADLAAAGVGPIPCTAPMPGRGGSRTAVPRYSVLAEDKVRFAGNPLAFVVAERLAQARDAADLVEAVYQDLPAVTECEPALAPGAPLLHEELDDNLSLDWVQGDEAAVAAAFAGASKIARIRIVNNRVVVNALEPRAALAECDPQTGIVTLTGGNQGIFRLKGQLAGVMGLDPGKLRLVCPDVGGSFGMKIFLYPEMVMTLFAALQLGRPVKWTAERTESFLSDTQGRDHVTEAAMAMDGSGRFLGLRVETWANMGAYLSNFGPLIPTGASTPMLSAVYKIPAIFANVKCVFTNTVPVDAYRGAGRPEAAYLLERLVEEAGRVAGLSPCAIRQRNFIQPADLPYDTGLNRIYDAGDFPRILAQACRRAGLGDLAARKAASAAAGKRRGLGIGCYIEACGGLGEETAEVTLEPGGGATVIVGTQTNGQGHLTAYAQLLNQQLGVDPAKVRMIQGDSSVVQQGGGTGGSRSLLMGGVSIGRACGKLIERARQIAGHVLETAVADLEFEAGVFTVAGTDRRMTLGEIVAAAGRAPDGLPDELTGPLREDGTYAAEALTYPNGCHICELEVDLETGGVSVERYTVVDDFGTLVNPLLVAGQVQGGTLQGLGQALLERTVYSADGQLLTGSWLDYCLPRAGDLPDLDLTFVEDIPCRTNPMGVKGAGEAGAIGAPPAIVNAILDALRPLGVTHIDMPATPERLWRAIGEARKA
ncbi:MAG: xanthine dehydrogenase family protein molybdopterin-binding subunit [Rhodospirillales bacterium]|nr:xanthine dehydrogenase family protein molybdopterin-binding subunit [Rhodospirillales bacterium]